MCYIIAEGIFLYYHFSLVISYHSGLLGAHIECRCSRSRREDVTITDVIMKTPDRKWTGDVKDVMPGSDGLGFLGILKKAVS